MVAIGQALGQRGSIEDQTFGEADSKEVDKYDVTYDVKMTDFEQFLEATLNHDGKVSFEKIKSIMFNSIKEEFNEHDKNQDGLIGWNEMYINMDPTHDVKMTDLIQPFFEVDLNHDGKLSIEEIKAYNLNFIKEGFNEYDKNQDGIIDLNETKQASDEDFAAPRGMVSWCDWNPIAYCWRGGHCELCESW